MSNPISEPKTVNTTDTLISGPKNRSYVGLQNLDAANSFHATFGGDVATALNGVRIGPGEYYELTVKNNNSEIRGIAITGAVAIVLITANNG